MLKALFLIDDGFEDLEFMYPYFRLLESGIKPLAASKDRIEKTGVHGYEYVPDLTFDEVDPNGFEILLLPGGKSPERVRTFKKAVEIVQIFMEKGKLVAAICHGPQILISANSLRWRKTTGYAGIQDDLRNAGAEVHDEEVVVDGNLITSRHVRDLPAFNRELMKKIQEMM
jgi:protease I